MWCNSVSTPLLSTIKRNVCPGKILASVFPLGWLCIRWYMYLASTPPRLNTSARVSPFLIVWSLMFFWGLAVAGGVGVFAIGAFVDTSSVMVVGVTSSELAKVSSILVTSIMGGASVSVVPKSSRVLVMSVAGGAECCGSFRLLKAITDSAKHKAPRPMRWGFGSV